MNRPDCSIIHPIIHRPGQLIYQCGARIYTCRHPEGISCQQRGHHVQSWVCALNLITGGNAAIKGSRPENKVRGELQGALRMERGRGNTAHDAHLITQEQGEEML